MTESYNLLDGFTMSYESTCRHCGGKNRISIKWEDGAFEVTQEDAIGTRWISVPVTPTITHLPVKVVE